MDHAEFDRFAEEYRALHTQNIRASGETPDFFAEYKVRDVASLVEREGWDKNLRVLDFGAGVGNSVPFFAKYLPDAQLTCIDVSARSLAVASERFPGMATYQVLDGPVLPFEQTSFDLVFTACVFHHIPISEHDALFREILRVLRPGGMFVIFEHNPRNPLTVRAVSTCPLDENAVLIDAEILRAKIGGAGFSSARSCYRIFFPGILRALRIVEPLLASLPLGAQYYIVARKPDVR